MTHHNIIEELEWQLKMNQGTYAAMKAVGFKNQFSLYTLLQRRGRPDLALHFYQPKSARKKQKGMAA